MRGFYINVNGGTAGVVNVKDDLQEYHKLLDCRCIDIERRKIAGREFIIILDDEGLLKEGELKVSAVNKNDEPELVGNLIVLQDGGRGELISLTPEECAWIFHNICYICTDSYDINKGHFALEELDYV